MYYIQGGRAQLAASPRRPPSRRGPLRQGHAPCRTPPLFAHGAVRWAARPRRSIAASLSQGVGVGAVGGGEGGGRGAVVLGDEAVVVPAVVDRAHRLRGHRRELASSPPVVGHGAGCRWRRPLVAPLPRPRPPVLRGAVRPDGAAAADRHRSFLVNLHT